MIELVVMDVDGTLTDGGIYYSENGIETKKFSTKDAAGILSAQTVGIKCMLLTGRESYAVERRAEDLNIQYVYQGVKNKEQFLQNFMKEKGIKKEHVLFIGDDLNDIKAMRMVGMAGCPSDAVEEVLDIADIVAVNKGGHGAVRDILFQILKKEGIYEEAVAKAYGRI